MWFICGVFLPTKNVSYYTNICSVLVAKCQSSVSCTVLYRWNKLIEVHRETVTVKGIISILALFPREFQALTVFSAVAV